MGESFAISPLCCGRFPHDLKEIWSGSVTSVSAGFMGLACAFGIAKAETRDASNSPRLFALTSQILMISRIVLLKAVSFLELLKR